MPQLMPFFWVNSVFMISVVIFSLIFFYYFKGFEMIESYLEKEKNFLNFNLMW